MICRSLRYCRNDMILIVIIGNNSNNCAAVDVLVEVVEVVVALAVISVFLL